MSDASLSNQSGSSQSMSNSSIKNAVMAIAMMLFLALSFKLAGDLTADNSVNSISQTDSVVSTLNQPNPQTLLTADK